MNRHKLYALLFAGALLAGCSVNGTGTPPVGVPSAPLTNLGTLQLAVGVANEGQLANAAGTSVVATFRQSNGLSATLVNTPTLTGPATWLVPAAGANPACGIDCGTNHLSGVPQQVAPSPTPQPASFGQTGGVFNYGIKPDNSTGTGGGAVYTDYSQPFFSTSTASTVFVTYRGAPPAYWFFDDGTWPNQQNGGGFRGFSQGFLMINIAPVAGTYTLNDVVATGNAGSATYSATATMNNTTLPPAQPAVAAASITKSGGGLTGTIVIPAATATFPFVETMVYVLDASTGYFYSAGPIKATGAQTFTIPGNLGPCFGGPGCQNTAAATATFNTGDTVRIYAVTYDWPMYESSSGTSPASQTTIINTSQTPTIVGSTGQADISTSPVTVITY